MGYNFYITRADDWSENDGREIGSEEWLNVVQNDPDLSLSLHPANGPFFALWDGPSELDGPWLDWDDGNVHTKNPDRALLDKMVEIAAILDANVQGDDGDAYPDQTLTDPHSLPTLPARILHTPHFPLILAIVSIASVVISLTVNDHFRLDGQVISPPGLLGIAILALAGLFGGVLSIILAVAALAEKRPGGRYAIAALVVCAAAIAWFAIRNS